MREMLQRILLPRRGEPHDVRSLYLQEAEQNKERLTWADRVTVTVPAGAEVSFETYFNAFPASYWRRWSQLDHVLLRMNVEGQASVDVYRSKIDGTRVSVDGQLVTDDIVEFSIPLSHFEDGGWLWFDVTAETTTTITEAGWYADVAPGPQTMPDGTKVGPFDKRATVGIPTFNRPADAVAALQALAEDPLVDAAIDAVIMPDQGNQHPADEPGYDEAVAHFGDRFHEFRQGNLGGSGGYSRIMYEALGDGAAVPRSPRSSSTWTTTSRSNPSRSCAPSRSPATPPAPSSSAARCSTCRNAASCGPWVRSSTAPTSCGARPSTPSPTTTSPATR